MASRRRQRRRACEGKRRHAGRQEAERALRRMKPRAQGVLNVYRCRNCGGWHVGHAPGFVQRALRSMERI